MRAEVLLHLGHTLIAVDKIDEARRELTSALSLASELGLETISMYAENMLGKIAEKKGMTGEAVLHYRSSLERYEAARENVRETTQQLGFAKSLPVSFGALARCLLKLGKIEDAYLVSEQAKGLKLIEQFRLGKIELRKGMTPDEIKKDDELGMEFNAAQQDVNRLQSIKSAPDVRKNAIERLRNAELNRAHFRNDVYVRLPELQTKQARDKPLTLAELGRTLSRTTPNSSSCRTSSTKPNR